MSAERTDSDIVESGERERARLVERHGPLWPLALNGWLAPSDSPSGTAHRSTRPTGVPR
jgi:hypothetical protein